MTLEELKKLYQETAAKGQLLANETLKYQGRLELIQELIEVQEKPEEDLDSGNNE